MQCPKCEAPMVVIVCDDIDLDQCQVCKGLWFDKGEAEELSVRWIAEFIDTGSAIVGELMDAIEASGCPRCGAAMKRFTDQSHSNLQYEQCDAHGKYFDAGEFTVWAESQYL